MLRAASRLHDRAPEDLLELRRELRVGLEAVSDELPGSLGRLERVEDRRGRGRAGGDGGLEGLQELLGDLVDELRGSRGEGRGGGDRGAGRRRGGDRRGGGRRDGRPRGGCGEGGGAASGEVSMVRRRSRGHTHFAVCMVSGGVWVLMFFCCCEVRLGCADVACRGVRGNVHRRRQREAAAVLSGSGRSRRRARRCRGDTAVRPGSSPRMCTRPHPLRRAARSQRLRVPQQTGGRTSSPHSSLSPARMPLSLALPSVAVGAFASASTGSVRRGFLTRYPPVGQ